MTTDVVTGFSFPVSPFAALRCKLLCSSKLRGLHDAPDEIGVEFGIKLSAEAGAFVASAGVEANYTITVKWTKK